MMVKRFIFQPALITDNDFKWRGKAHHLTYQGHIPSQWLFDTVQNATSTVLYAWSVVWEVSDLGYNHTHLGLIFMSEINLTGSRKFDCRWIDYTDVNNPQGTVHVAHPHVVEKANMRALEQLFMYYHAGYKFKASTNKMEYTPPLFLSQHIPPGLEWTRLVIEDIEAAQNLKEACVVACIRPKTVACLEKVRADFKVQSRKRTRPPPYTKDSFTLNIRLPHTLWIWGASGIGKTKWAQAQYPKALMVKPFNSIGSLEAIKRKYDPEEHDAVILDEVNLACFSDDFLKCFFDQDDDCEVAVRYSEFTLPPLPKILISNGAPADLMPKDPSGAIARRLQCHKIVRPTYV